MKIVTPPSYVKIFSMTASGSAVQPTHRGLLLVSSGSAGSIAVTLQDGSTQTISNIPANTIFILPLVIKYLTSATNVTVYGLA